MMIAQRIIVFLVLLTSTGTKGQAVCLVFFKLFSVIILQEEEKVPFWKGNLGAAGAGSGAEPSPGSTVLSAPSRGDGTGTRTHGRLVPFLRTTPTRRLSEPGRHQGSPVPARDFQPIRHGSAPRPASAPSEKHG